MLTMLGNPRRCCDGLTRRETLKVGALSALGGFGLADYLQAAQTGHAKPGKAKSVILLYLLGGAATQDMFDMKPLAPPEVRGEFKPVATNVNGIQICEHLPQMTRWMHKAAIVRSVNHKAGCHNCLPSYSGYELQLPDQHPHPVDPPSMGSVCEYLKAKAGRHTPRADDFPDYIYMPCWLGWGQAFRRGGPYGGFLGPKFDPLITVCDPYNAKEIPNPSPGNPAIVRGMPLLPDSTLGPQMTIDRLSSRRGILQQIDAERRRGEGQLSVASYSDAQKRAFDVLTSSKLRTAFDLSREDPKQLDRYGRTLFGNCALIGRRLVEAGVRFVNVTWDLFWGPVNIDYDAWDTHTNNFKILRTNKLPFFDQTYTALMQDLEDRGLLDETLVVTMSEMGRTPRVNPNAGRDHWTFCYSVLFAGAGIKGGTIYGESDAQAAYVKDRPVSTADICATIYHCLGIDPNYRVPDHAGRPVGVAQGGEPVREILA
jgi:hypothetical protein